MTIGVCTGNHTSTLPLAYTLAYTLKRVKPRMVAQLHDSEPLVLADDAQLRQQLFGAAVMRHPAKQSLVQLMHLLERFAVPGGLLLDPFGGSGSAMLAAAPQYGGMYVITTELASHFLAMQHQAWQHFQCSLDMQDVWGTPPGDYVALAGDSRQLVEVLGESDAVDLIITSPSYGGSEAVDRRDKQNSTIAAHGGGNEAKAGYSHGFKIDTRKRPAGKQPRVGYQQIERLPPMPNPRKKHGFGPHSQLSAKMAGYVDTIITSPPYQDAINGNVGIIQERIASHYGPNSQVACGTSYGVLPENIGNQRGKKYLDSMRLVWQGCAAVLKPGGILCCITRDCVRKGKRVPVGEQNKALLIEAGLTFLEVETWRVPAMSFWRILQHKKNPGSPIIDSEQVWIFEKTA